MSKGIINRNSKGQLHGYQEWYHSDSKLWVKGFSHNGIRINYEEYYYHQPNGKLEKTFYI